MHIFGFWEGTGLRKQEGKHSLSLERLKMLNPWFCHCWDMFHEVHASFHESFHYIILLLSCRKLLIVRFIFFQPRFPFQIHGRVLSLRMENNFALSTCCSLSLCFHTPVHTHTHTFPSLHSAGWLISLGLWASAWEGMRKWKREE